ncbi:hypothetical protein ACFOEY_08920 [Paracandidimonas soli]
MNDDILASSSPPCSLASGSCLNGAGLNKLHGQATKRYRLE